MCNDSVLLMCKHVHACIHKIPHTRDNKINKPSSVPKSNHHPVNEPRTPSLKYYLQAILMEDTSRGASPESAMDEENSMVEHFGGTLRAGRLRKLWVLRGPLPTIMIIIIFIISFIFIIISHCSFSNFHMTFQLVQIGTG